MSDNEWGFGNAERKPFGISKMDDGTPFTLMFGEHPHSRSDNNIYACFPDGTIADFDGHRILTRVELRIFNYLKCSGLSGNEVRKGGQYRIYFNERLVWAKFIRDDVRGLQDAAHAIPRLLDCPFKLWAEKGPEIGRKVFYRNHPAIVKDWDCSEDEGSGNRIYLVADPPPFPAAPWDDTREQKEQIVDNTLSPHIWWFRDEKRRPADA